MENRSLVTIAEHSREKILYMLEMAKEFEAHPNRHILDGKVVATLFFEPSTRTRLSFETAANRLGARVIGFSDPKATSSSKGETLKDTIKMVSNYADIIVMRHHLEGAARYASEVTTVPIVNAGDGANQHPSQTMLDLYSIYKTQGTLENLNIFLVGDLKYGRTVHSLLMAMRHFNPTFHFIAPDELRMPEEYKIYCREHNIKYVEHTDFTEEIIADADILYMTRVRRLGVKADMGGKTGTTNYNADGWFMGFTPSLVSGCWVGGEDRDIHFDTMLHGQGASMALPIWTKYMVKVLGDKSLGYDENETFQLPEGYDPCKDDVNLEGDTHIEEPIEGLDELFN